MSEPDPGPAAVAAVVERLAIDPDWSSRHERGLSWIPYRLRQDISASPTTVVDGTPVSTVGIRTVVIEVEAASASMDDVLATSNADPALDGLLWHPTERVLSAACSAVVHQANLSWVPDVLATAAALQVVSSHARAHRLADVLGGSVAVAEHPERGLRPEMDPLFAIPSQAVLPAGREPSAYRDDLWAEAVADLRELGLAAPSSPADARTIRCTSPAGGRAGARILVDCEAHHPQLGAGARVTLDVGGDAGGTAPAALALAEWRGTGDRPTSLLGAWTAGPRFTTFLPNLLARPGLVANVVLQHVARAAVAATVDRPRSR